MKNFTFAMKWHEILKPYSDDIRREVYDAIIEYVATGTVIEMQPLARMAFDFIRYEIDEKARRREARLAKKQQVSSATQSDDADRITDMYYSQKKAPEPVTVSNGGVSITMNKERIRTFVKQCVKDMIAKGRKPGASDPKFMSSLDCLVTNRFEVLRDDLISRRPTAPLSEDLWNAIIQNAHSEFSA
ncbi:MAG: hypothetical protein K2H39_09100 [Paramuribaculum sp.]|nr:hypothetical protein [Paramuribaculum sp.]